MTNIYLRESEEEEAIVDFVKDHEELYNKTNGHFKDKSKEVVSPGEIPNIRMLYKTCFELQRTHYDKLKQSKSGQALKKITEHQT